MRTLLSTTMFLGLSGCFLVPQTHGRAIRKVCELEEECPEGSGDSAEVCAAETEIQLEHMEDEECRDAIYDLQHCLARLNCDGYEDYFTEPVEDYPCFEEDIVIQVACSWG